MSKFRIALVACLVAGCTVPPDRAVADGVHRDAFARDDSPLVAARVQAACECAPTLLFVFADDRAVLFAVSSQPLIGFVPTSSYDADQLGNLLDAAEWQGGPPTQMTTLAAAEKGWNLVLRAPWAEERTDLKCRDASRIYYRWGEHRDNMDKRAWSCDATTNYARLLDAIVVGGFELGRSERKAQE